MPEITTTTTHQSETSTHRLCLSCGYLTVEQKMGSIGPKEIRTARQATDLAEALVAMAALLEAKRA